MLGFLRKRIYRKEDKLYIEVPNRLLEKEFFVSISIAQGIGDRSLLGGMSWGDGDDWVWVFRKRADKLQVVRKNVRFFAKSGSPEANASGGGYESGFHVNNDDTMSLYSPWGEEMKAVVIDTDMNGELRYPYTGGTYYSTSRKFLWWDWGPDDVWNNSDDYGNFDHPDAPWN